MNTKTLLEAALQLAQQGYSIIPLRSKGKTPLIHWEIYQRRKATAEEIEAWWTQWPDANIGIVCGEISNLVVLDIDDQEGYQYLISLGVHLEDNPTVIVRTHRGMHYYFQYPDTKVQTRNFKSGEIRSDGSYVVCPPSVHPDGGEYSWMVSPDVQLPAPLPTELLSLPIVYESDGIENKLIEGTKLGLEKICQGCQLMREAQINPNGISEPLWYCMITNLIPFIGGRNKIHELSANYHKPGGAQYSFEETGHKIAHALKDSPGPHTCEYIRLQGFKGCQNCEYFGKVRTPLSIATSVDSLQISQGGRTHLFTLHDALREQKPVQYIVEGLISIPSLTIVYGAPGSMKSFLLADMGISVASGMEWLGSKVPGQVSGRATIKSPALWLDYDNGLHRCHTRFAAILHAKGTSPDIPFYYDSIPPVWLDASDNKSIQTLCATIDEHQIKLGIIDNLTSIRGVIDENSSQMGKVMANLRMLVEMKGISLIVIHHQNKGNGEYQMAKSERLRGHSSILAAVDLALYLERKSTKDIVNITATKCRDQEIEPFAAEFVYQNKQGSRELAQAGFYGIKNRDTITSADFLSAIRTVLLEGQCNKGQLVERIREKLPRISQSHIADEIARMEAEGILIHQKGDRGAKFYSLVENLN